MTQSTDHTASILALDLGTTTGWAVRNSRCRIVHGTAEFRPSRYEGGGMRYLRFGKWLDQTLEITGGIDARGGSVCLNSRRGFLKWTSASVMPPLSRWAAG